MSAGSSGPIWFPEPSATDNTYARRGEASGSWLARSTLVRAREFRRFLNENLSELPPDFADGLSKRLGIGRQYGGAFFEMTVARTLQVLGASIIVEPESMGGTRIDFLAEFRDGKVGVEATAPVFNATVGEEFKARAALLDLLDREAPQGWSIMVSQASVSDGRHQMFKRFIREMFRDIDPPTKGAEPVVLSLTDEQEEQLGGMLEMRLLPKQYYPDRAVVGEPGIGFVDDTEQRIRHAVTNKRKLRQAREASLPVIVAVKMPQALSTSNRREFDLALYGRTVQAVGRLAELKESPIWFEPDGEWTRRKGDGQPSIAGVLAYLGVEIAGGPDPVLYLHPRFKGDLPIPLLELEQRRFVWDTLTIESVRARTTGVLDRISWVRMDLSEESDEAESQTVLE